MTNEKKGFFKRLFGDSGSQPKDHEKPDLGPGVFAGLVHASPSLEGYIPTWEALIAYPAGHLVFTNGGNYLVAASLEGHIAVWETENWQRTNDARAEVPDGSRGMAGSCRIILNSNQSRIAVCRRLREDQNVRGEIQIRSFPDLELLESEPFDGDHEHLAWLPDADRPTIIKSNASSSKFMVSPCSRFAVAYSDKVVESLDVDSGDVIATWQVPKDGGRPEAVCFGKNNRVAVRTGGWDYVFYLTLPELHYISTVGHYEVRHRGHRSANGRYLTAGFIVDEERGGWIEGRGDSIDYFIGRERLYSEPTTSHYTGNWTDYSAERGLVAVNAFARGEPEAIRIFSSAKTFEMPDELLKSACTELSESGGYRGGNPFHRPKHTGA